MSEPADPGRGNCFGADAAHYAPAREARLMRTMMQGHYDELDALARLSTDAIKRKWDDPDACDVPGGISCDAIHEVLNARGEGDYCAV